MSLEDAILLAERADAAIMYTRSHHSGYHGRSGYRGRNGNDFRHKRHKTHHRSSNGGYNRSDNGYAPMDIDVVESSGARGSGGTRGNHMTRGKVTCYYCGKQGHV